MKTVLLTLILLTTLHSGFTQSDTTQTDNIFPLKDNVIFYEIIDSTLKGVSKEQLYTRAKTWVIRTFNYPRAVTEMDDKENGIIMGKGAFDYVTPMVQMSIQRGTIKYTFKITVRDNKYRFQIFDLLRENNSPVSEWYQENKTKTKRKYIIKQFEIINEKIKSLIDDFITSIRDSSKANKDDF
jgi:hypothetical protein